MFVHHYRPQTVLRVTGEDAFNFLQGQFTNDLRQGESNGAVYGLWLNQKGRVIADSQVLSISANEFQVVGVASRAADVRPRLEAYIVADDVMLMDETETTHGLALGGPGSGEIIQQVFGAIPAAGHFVRSGDMLAFAGRRGRGKNFEIIGPEKSLAALNEKMIAHGCVDVGPAEMELRRIQAGIPAIPQDLGATDLPNEGGLEESAISYTKGCYLGQEVMARLKNLGQVRRRLHLISGEGAAPTVPTVLYQGAKKAGEIRSVARTGNGFVGIAMLSLLGLDREAGLSLGPDGPADIRIHAHE